MEGVLAQAEQQESESPLLRKRSETISHTHEERTPNFNFLADTVSASPQLVNWQGQQELIAPGGGLGVKAMSRNFDAIRARSLSSPQLPDLSDMPATRKRSASKVQQMRAQLAEKERTSGGFKNLTMEGHRVLQSKQREQELRKREEAKNILMKGGSPAGLSVADEVSALTTIRFVRS
jgi:hypothetical protein